MKINPKLKKDLKSFLLANIQKEQNRVLVMSADTLGSDEKKVLSKKFSDLNWNEADFQVDSSIIAGVIIKVGSKTIDLSLMGSLSKLSNTLYEID
ncbi:MAG: F0F1 ATP synthase subunit delta [Patescibacteria group bacterium]